MVRSIPSIYNNHHYQNHIKNCDYANVRFCMATQLDIIDSPSPGTLAISCQNYSDLWDKLVSSLKNMKLRSLRPVLCIDFGPGYA